jgi:hypothetical protein
MLKLTSLLFIQLDPNSEARLRGKIMTACVRMVAFTRKFSMAIFFNAAQEDYIDVSAYRLTLA